jgi:hypothetical protein
MIGAIDVILLLSFLLYRHLQDGYSFRLLGELFSSNVEVFSGQVINIGPLLGLEGCALIVHLNCKVPKEVLPQIESFKFYSKPPARPHIYLHLQLFGRGITRESIIIEKVVTQIKGRSWEESHEGDYQEQHIAELPVSPCPLFPEYFLQIKVDADYKMPQESEIAEKEIPLQLRVKLAVGLQAKYVLVQPKCSLRKAKLESLGSLIEY